MKKAAAKEYPHTDCPVRIDGRRCGRAVEGRDPMRPCPACREAGAPPRVSWEIAKPDDSALSGETVLVSR